MKLLIALTFIVHTGCSPLFLGVANEPPIAMIQQKDLWDCGIATIAMMAHKSYTEVEVAMDRLQIDPIANQGIYETQAIRVLKEFGIEVKQFTTANMAEDEGIVHIKWRDSNTHHYIYISHGWVYDPLNQYPVPVDVSPENWDLILFLKKQ